MTTDQPKRRAFRYSLRTLMLVVTLICIGFGWLGLKLKEGREQRNAIAAIRGLGGVVEFDYEFDERGFGIEDYPAMGGIGPPPEPSGPRWLRAVLGDDMFCYVKIASLGYRDVTATDLTHLEHLPGLLSLDLSHSTIDDSRLPSLYGLTDLRDLWLIGTQVTDEGVKKLQEALPNCKILVSTRDVAKYRDEERLRLRQ